MFHNAAVTVVIPTLDEERTIEGCLASIGTDPDVHVVVSDGGSRDRTVELVEAHGQVSLVCGPPGRGQQLNRGAAVATTPLLLFLHADCRLPDGWQTALRQALADEATALACFRLRTERANRSENSTLRGAWLRLLDLRSRGLGLPYGDQGYGMRRTVFEELGGFPEIPLMEDVALAQACRRRGEIHRIPLEVRTTARRFEKFPVRMRLMTATFPVLYGLGVSPQRLARWYRQVR